MQLLFEGDHYSRVASVRRNTVHVVYAWKIATSTPEDYTTVSVPTKSYLQQVRCMIQMFVIIGSMNRRCGLVSNFKYTPASK